MATTPLVPSQYPFALDGRPFLVSYAAEDGGYTSSSVPLLRGQTDQGARPGEQSLSPDDLWRRSVESWHHGAGQTRADREASDPYRFRASLHADVFTKYKLGVLNTTSFLDAHSYGDLVVADSAMWSQHATGMLKWTGSVATVTGLPPATYAAASDGQNVYTVHGVDAIYRTPGAGTTGASYVTNASADLRLVRFAKGRLLAFSQAGAVYNPVAAGALPGALFTHPLGASFHWTDATEGESVIYMCGYSGDGSEAHGVVYYTDIKPDGTALDVPVVAARLPDGEQALSVCGYLGLVFIGTSLGVRVCLELDGGALRVGPLVATGPCYCFEPQGSQVWFGWSDDEQLLLNDGSGAEKGGLGRIDLSEFTFGEGAPAYANDLKVTLVTTTAQSVVTWQGKRYFCTTAALYRENAGSPHETAYLASGAFSFGITEPKVFHYLTAKPAAGGTLPLVAYLGEERAVVDGTVPLQRTNLDLGDEAVSGVGFGTVSGIFDLKGRRAESVEYILRLDQTTSVARATLLARPAVNSRSEIINVTVMLDTVLDVNGADTSRVPRDDVAFLRELTKTAAPVPIQEGSETYDAVLEDYMIVREKGSEIASEGGMQGSARLRLKRHDTVAAVFRSASSASATASSLTIPMPDGVLSGDRMYAALAWGNAAVANPTVSAGWTLLNSGTNLNTTPPVNVNFASATYVNTVPNPGPLVITFGSVVNAVGAMAAYVVPGDIVDYTAVSALEQPMFQNIAATILDAQDAYTLSMADSTAMVSAFAFQANAADTAFVGPLRSRVRSQMVATLAATRPVLAVEIGDALSVSKAVLPSDIGPLTAGQIVDQVDTLVVYSGGGHRIYNAGITKP